MLGNHDGDDDEGEPSQRPIEPPMPLITSSIVILGMVLLMLATGSKLNTRFLRGRFFCLKPVESRFDTVGLKVLQGFGQTE